LGNEREIQTKVNRFFYDKIHLLIHNNPKTFADLCAISKLYIDTDIEGKYFKSRDQYLEYTSYERIQKAIFNFTPQFRDTYFQIISRFTIDDFQRADQICCDNENRFRERMKIPTRIQPEDCYRLINDYNSRKSTLENSDQNLFKKDIRGVEIEHSEDLDAENDFEEESVYMVSARESNSTLTGKKLTKVKDKNRLLELIFLYSQNRIANVISDPIVKRYFESLENEQLIQWIESRRNLPENAKKTPELFDFRLKILNEILNSDKIKRSEKDSDLGEIEPSEASYPMSVSIKITESMLYVEPPIQLKKPIEITLDLTHFYTEQIQDLLKNYLNIFKTGTYTIPASYPLDQIRKAITNDPLYNKDGAFYRNIHRYNPISYEKFIDTLQLASIHLYKKVVIHYMEGYFKGINHRIRQYTSIVNEHQKDPTDPYSYTIPKNWSGYKTWMLDRSQEVDGPGYYVLHNTYKQMDSHLIKNLPIIKNSLQNVNIGDFSQFLYSGFVVPSIKYDLADSFNWIPDHVSSQLKGIRRNVDTQLSMSFNDTNYNKYFTLTNRTQQFLNLVEELKRSIKTWVGKYVINPAWNEIILRFQKYHLLHVLMTVDLAGMKGIIKDIDVKNALQINTLCLAHKSECRLMVSNHIQGMVIPTERIIDQCIQECINDQKLKIKDLDKRNLSFAKAQSLLNLLNLINDKTTKAKLTELLQAGIFPSERNLRGISKLIREYTPRFKKLMPAIGKIIPKIWFRMVSTIIFKTDTLPSMEKVRDELIFGILPSNSVTIPYSSKNNREKYSPLELQNRTELILDRTKAFGGYTGDILEYLRKQEVESFPIYLRSQNIDTITKIMEESRKQIKELMLKRGWKTNIRLLGEKRIQSNSRFPFDVIDSFLTIDKKAEYSFENTQLFQMLKQPFISIRIRRRDKQDRLVSAISQKIYNLVMDENTALSPLRVLPPMGHSDHFNIQLILTGNPDLFEQRTNCVNVCYDPTTHQPIKSKVTPSPKNEELNLSTDLNKKGDHILYIAPNADYVESKLNQLLTPQFKNEMIDYIQIELKTKYPTVDFKKTIGDLQSTAANYKFENQDFDKFYSAIIYDKEKIHSSHLKNLVKKCEAVEKEIPKVQRAKNLLLHYASQRNAEVVNLGFELAKELKEIKTKQNLTTVSFLYQHIKEVGDELFKSGIILRMCENATSNILSDRIAYIRNCTDKEIIDRVEFIKTGIKNLCLTIEQNTNVYHLASIQVTDHPKEYLNNLGLERENAKTKFKKLITDIELVYDELISYYSRNSELCKRFKIGISDIKSEITEKIKNLTTAIDCEADSYPIHEIEKLRIEINVYKIEKLENLMGNATSKGIGIDIIDLIKKILYGAQYKTGFNTPPPNLNYNKGESKRFKRESMSLTELGKKIYRQQIDLSEYHKRKNALDAEIKREVARIIAQVIIQYHPNKFGYEGLHFKKGMKGRIAKITQYMPKTSEVESGITLAKAYCKRNNLTLETRFYELNPGGTSMGVHTHTAGMKASKISEHIFKREGKNWNMTWDHERGDSKDRHLVNSHVNSCQRMNETLKTLS
jgi:hypothetical protein